MRREESFILNARRRFRVRANTLTLDLIMLQFSPRDRRCYKDTSICALLPSAEHTWPCMVVPLSRFGRGHTGIC